MTEWQPIETMHELSKRVLVIQKTLGDYEDCQCVAWLVAQPAYYVWRIDQNDETLSHRHLMEARTNWNCPGFGGLIPTHWTLLPEPPK